MIGFNERTDNKEKIGLEGTGSEVCGCVTSSLRGGCESFSYNPVSNNRVKMKQSELLIDNFTLEYVGEIPAQNKKKMEKYFALILRQASYDFNIGGLKPGKVGEKQTCKVVSEVTGRL